MILDESSVNWLGSRNLADVPPVRQQYLASRVARSVERIFYDPDESRMWRMQKERQQRIAREAGRIDYIGNAGLSVGDIASVFFFFLNERKGALPSPRRRLNCGILTVAEPSRRAMRRTPLASIIGGLSKKDERLPEFALR